MKIWLLDPTAMNPYYNVALAAALASLARRDGKGDDQTQASG